MRKRLAAVIYQWFNLKHSGRILSKFLPIIEHLRRTILSREKIKVLQYFFPGVYTEIWHVHQYPYVGLNSSKVINGLILNWDFLIQNELLLYYCSEE
jgi:hypothetical protein